jgi:hypothetical protein
MDPNGILVEWCATTRAFSDADRADAERLLTVDKPPLGDAPAPDFHQAEKSAAATWSRRWRQRAAGSSTRRRVTDWIHATGLMEHMMRALGAK